ncbi:hypothetical protein IFO70_27700 [Phormidium tenue FACHB-886]|nr:hypothetical protein [Phormidium tenue FACHB-886]
MSDTLNLFIDLKEAGLDLELEELETYSQILVKDLKDGLAEDAMLIWSTDISERSKPIEPGFDLVILKAEVNPKNISAVLS